MDRKSRGIENKGVYENLNSKLSPITLSMIQHINNVMVKTFPITKTTCFSIPFIWRNISAMQTSRLSEILISASKNLCFNGFNGSISLIYLISFHIRERFSQNLSNVTNIGLLGNCKCCHFSAVRFQRLVQEIVMTSPVL